MTELRVALPGRVEKYDNARQVADVKPLVQRRIKASDGSFIVESLPVLPEVPVVFPRAGDLVLTFPIEVGHHVQLLFNDHSIDQWYSGDGSEVDPLDIRSQSLSDAVALPGFYPSAKAITPPPPGTAFIGDSTGIPDFVALSTKVITELTAIKSAIAGAVVVAGDGGASLKATILTALASFPGSVAASDVQAT